MNTGSIVLKYYKLGLIRNNLDTDEKVIKLNKARERNHSERIIKY